MSLSRCPEEVRGSESPSGRTVGRSSRSRSPRRGTGLAACGGRRGCGMWWGNFSPRYVDGWRHRRRQTGRRAATGEEHEWTPGPGPAGARRGPPCRASRTAMKGRAAGPAAGTCLSRPRPTVSVRRRPPSPARAAAPVAARHNPPGPAEKSRTDLRSRGRNPRPPRSATRRAGAIPSMVYPGYQGRGGDSRRAHPAAAGWICTCSRTPTQEASS